ncbi:hypothetical protein HDU76_006017, partial [Blyttiomyces sp. JEL0837]
IVSGDIVNADHSFSHLRLSLAHQGLHSKKDLEDEFGSNDHDKEFVQVMSGLQSMCDKVFYIPGNHDPEGAFTDQTTIQEQIANLQRNKGRELWKDVQRLTRAVNFHNALVRIAPNLVMAGMGGSVNETLHGSPETVTAKGKWRYPNTESEMESKLTRLLSKRQPELPERNFIECDQTSGVGAEESTILVTHCGPAGSGKAQSSTGTLVPSQTNLPSNLPSSQSLLFKKRKAQPNESEFKDSVPPNRTAKKLSEASPSPLPSLDVLFHVHGHSHSSWGVSHIGKIPIINPGPLRDGYYAEVLLRQELDYRMMRKWYLAGVSINRL